jgi:hypothetical protein
MKLMYSLLLLRYPPHPPPFNFSIIPLTCQLQDPNFQESIKRNITTAADTVQKTSLASYQAIGKQVSTHTGVQLPGASNSSLSPLGSPSVTRKEEDYDDFWAENGVGGESKGTSAGGSSTTVGNSAPAGSAKSKGVSGGKEDEWESW